jgi:hypothetical protein
MLNLLRLVCRTGNSLGWEWEMPMLQPNSHLINQRKMLRRAIGPQRVASHDRRIEYEVAQIMTVLNTFQGAPIDVVQK